MFTNIKLVICDLDGTLVDSVPDLTFCVDEMLAQLSKQPAGEPKVRTWVGNGIEALVRRALTGKMDGEPEQPLFEKALPMFMDLYAKNTSKLSCLFPGVEQGLDRLIQHKIKLACVTNKLELFTTPLLKGLGLSDRFEIVLSGDSLPEKKPSPMPLLHAAQHVGVTPEHCLMVGDSISDVRAARAANMPIICLPYGYNHGQDIRTAKPDAVIVADPAILADFIAMRRLGTELADVEAAKAAHPNAVFIAHPECRPEVVELADAAVSTSGMLRFAAESDASEFIVGTEVGLLYSSSE